MNLLRLMVQKCLCTLTFNILGYRNALLTFSVNTKILMTMKIILSAHNNITNDFLVLKWFPTRSDDEDNILQSLFYIFIFKI